MKTVEEVKQIVVEGMKYSTWEDYVHDFPTVHLEVFAKVWAQEEEAQMKADILEARKEIKSALAALKSALGILSEEHGEDVSSDFPALKSMAKFLTKTAHYEN